MTECYNEIMTINQRPFQFDPIDQTQMRLTASISPGQRIQRLLNARNVAVGLMRGRIRQRYPELTTREINLKIIEELSHA